MRKPLSIAILLLSLAAGPASPQGPCDWPNPPVDPYVFILLDISGSMNHSTVCSSSSQCFTSMQGDHPDSKWVMTRKALYNVLSTVEGVNFGFATFSNQDALRVRAKHWLYQADNGGPVLPGSVGAGGGPFPAAGSQEVFGLTWPCATGASDGCSASVPADLNDPWEVTRVRRLPKGGDDLTQTVDVYVRTTIGGLYKVRYAPVGGSLGGPVQTTVTTWSCNNSTCSAPSLLGSQSVSWTPVGDFLSWENSTGAASRSQPYSYFNQSVANDSAATLCPTLPRWEPNGDDTADTYTQAGGPGYSLKQPTDASDPRGTFFSVGDVIPLDWNDNHRDDLLARLAPNLSVDPLATPDFRTAAYFQDHPMVGETFLRLKDETARPLVPLGLSPLGWSLRSFRSWFDGCTQTGCPTSTGWNDVAWSLDPEWTCRQIYLLLITDSVDECSPQNACYDVASLYAYAGVKTSVIALGLPSPTSQITCLVQNGKGTAYYVGDQSMMEYSLTDFFTNTVGVQP